MMFYCPTDKKLLKVPEGFVNFTKSKRVQDFFCYEKYICIKFHKFFILGNLLIWKHVNLIIFESKLNYFGKNKSLLQEIYMKFLTMKHKGQKNLKSVFNSSRHSRHLFASQIRRKIELGFCV
jgi:hypothetical protein